MMSYICILGNGGEGHFTEGNRDIKAKNSDMVKK